MTQRVQQLLEQPLLDHAAVDVRSAARLTYVLRQNFRYEYDRPVRGLRQRLVVVPARQHGSARRVLHRLRVSAPDSTVTGYRQRDGNMVAVARVPFVRRSVEFTVAAVVERLGSWTDHELPATAALDPRWLRPTRLTTADEAVHELTAGLRGTSHVDIGESLCSRVHERIGYEYGITSTVTTAAEALAGGRGVCQDHAHVMLAGCRSLGVPARYVSGHLLGQGGMHAWVEVLVPDRGITRAIALDPCNGCHADARYLTVAVGRDYADVAPVSGTYSGRGLGRLTASQQVGLAAAA